MKHNYVFLVFLMAILLSGNISCGTSTSADNNAMFEDTTSSWSADSLRIVNATTTDLAFFNLHGPVQKLVEKDAYGTTTRYEFSRDGKLQKVNGYNPFTVDVYSDDSGSLIRFERDENGRIHLKSGWESELEYTWDGNHLTGTSWGEEGTYGMEIYTYDERGFVVSSKSMSGDYSDESMVEQSTTHYTYPSVDEYGNWTERREGNKRVHRTITYYPITR